MTEIISLLVSLVAVIIAVYSAMQAKSSSDNARKTYKESRNQTTLLLNQVAAQWNLDIQVYFEDGNLEDQLRRGPVIENNGRGSGIIYGYSLDNIELDKTLTGSGLKVKIGADEKFKDYLHFPIEDDNLPGELTLERIVEAVKRDVEFDIVLKYYSIESRVNYTHTQPYSYDKARDTLTPNGDPKISKDFAKT